MVGSLVHLCSTLFCLAQGLSISRLGFLHEMRFSLWWIKNCICQSPKRDWEIAREMESGEGTAAPSSFFLSGWQTPRSTPSFPSAAGQHENCFLPVKCIRWYFKLMSESLYPIQTHTDKPQNNKTSVLKEIIQ